MKRIIGYELYDRPRKRSNVAKSVASWPALRVAVCAVLIFATYAAW